MKYFLIVQLATTGQLAALDTPNEAACLADLARVQSGVYRVIHLDNGLVLPVLRGIGCMSEVEYAARKGGGV